MIIVIESTLLLLQAGVQSSGGSVTPANDISTDQSNQVIDIDGTGTAIQTDG